MRYHNQHQILMFSFGVWLQFQILTGNLTKKLLDKKRGKKSEKKLFDFFKFFDFF